MIEYENLSKSNNLFNKEYKKEFDRILKEGRFILGKNVTSFEEKFAKYVGTDFCVGVNSGLDALTLAIKSLKLPKNSEIIVPSNTYIATILAIINNGLKPVLVEPRIDTYNINPELIEEHITCYTKAILVVHLYGKVCEMDSIKGICKRNNLYLIEDCAQSHGATYNLQMTGSFGDLGCFSFYPTKNLGALGDGGAITINNLVLNKGLRILRNYGSEIKYENIEVGFNSRLDDLQAAFLNIKLKYLDKINKHKRKLAKIYFDNLKSDFIVPVQHEDYYDVFHIFNIRHKKRNELREYLLKEGIITEIHYPIPPHKQKAINNLFNKDYPISEEIHNTTLSLPISFFHTEEDIYKVVEILNKF